MKKKLLFSLVAFATIFLLTGCSNDSMDNIEIIVTNYPNEYVIKELYSEHATITSIYPDGVDIDNYKITNKQKKEYAKKDLFIYNGLVEKERSLAIDLLSINPELKIIDTAYALETNYSKEELWLNPSSLLMMSQNIRLSLKEYITSSYLQKEVDTSYEELKILLSELDTDYRVAFDSTNNKTIIVANPSLKYLEKFGLQVISVDSEATQKAISDAENLIKAGTVSYIFSFREEELNDNAKQLLANYGNIQSIELHKLDNITDEERSEKKDYIILMQENLELIKKELYQ